MHKIILSALLVASLFLVSCTDEKDPAPSTKANVKFKVNVTAGASPFILNKNYTTADGLEYSMDVARFYLSDITLIKEDGGKVNMKELVFVDLDNPISEPYDRSSIGTEFTFEVEAGNYKALELGVGVPKRMNVVSNDYENDHPLSIYRGTDWSWAGYRFLMLEGQARNGSSGDKTGFDYHIASDTFYQQVKLDKKIDISPSVTHDIVLNIDMNKVFRPVDDVQKTDPVKEPITHSDETEEKINLAWKVIRNFSKAISL
ncbi:MAG: MbnP family protein [Bacteroidia bacterium]